MYMAGRTKYGVKPRVKIAFFLQSKNTPVDFGEKISFLHICANRFFLTEIPESQRGTVFGEGGDANVGNAE